MDKLRPEKGSVPKASSSTHGYHALFLKTKYIDQIMGPV